MAPGLDLAAAIALRMLTLAQVRFSFLSSGGCFFILIPFPGS